MNNSSVPKDIRRLSRERAPEFHRILKTPRPERIGPGQIWSTYAHIELGPDLRFETDDPRLVVIIDRLDESKRELEQVTAAPVSLDVSMASEFDLICSRGTSPLGFAFIAEVWNETPVIKTHLKQFLGSLRTDAMNALEELYKRHLVNEQVPFSLSNWVGPRLIGKEDPRFAFQVEEVEAAAYLAQAATAALESEADTSKATTAASEVTEEWRSFVTLPMLRRLSEVLHGPTPAYAAGMPEEKAYMVSGSEKDDYFTFELLTHRTGPYEDLFNCA